MRFSFDDEESFKEAVESLRFNNARQQIGSSNSIALEDSEFDRDEGDIIPSDPITLRRARSTSSLSIQETRRSAATVLFKFEQSHYKREVCSIVDRTKITKYSITI